MNQFPPLPALRGSDDDHIRFRGDPPRWSTQPEAASFTVNLGSDDEQRLPEKNTVVGLMARCGITSTGDWSDTSHSSSLQVTANGPRAWQLWHVLWRALDRTDVWVTPSDRPPVKLLMCDMDSTLITTESLDELAAFTGIGEQVAAITARAMNGELDFKAALDERVGLLENMDYALVESCVRDTVLSDGAQTLLAKARAHNVRTILVSGGFTPFAEHVANILGMDHIVANRLDVQDGKLAGRVLPPIVTKDTKLDVLNEQCSALNLSAQQCCTLGDGANDIPMLQAAGTGVAYRAKNVVLAATPYHLSHAPLDVLADWLTWPD